MKKLIISMLFLMPMVTFGYYLKGLSQKGDYCVFKTEPEISTLFSGVTSEEYTVYDAKCVIKQLDYDLLGAEPDFHYESYGGKKFDVPILFFALEKGKNLSRIHRIEFGDGVEIIGDGHTGRLGVGEITKYNISGNILKIMENHKEED